MGPRTDPRDTTIYSSKTRIKTIYGYMLITIRQIGLKPII